MNPCKSRLIALILINALFAMPACGRTGIQFGRSEGEASANAAVSFATVVGESYEVSASTNFVDWTPIATVSGTGNEQEWRDRGPESNGYKFYHVNPVSTPNGNLSAGSLTVTQSWSQETDYLRDALVKMPTNPENPDGPHPVVITLHGSGGSPNLNAFGYLNSRYIHVAPRGYMNQWNLGRQNTKAPDVEFMRNILQQLRRYDNVDAGNIAIIGTSNGSNLLNQLLIELNGALFQHAIGTVTPLVTEQYHDGQFWGDSDITSNFKTIFVPAAGRRILCMGGTVDSLIPYLGGTGVAGFTFLGGQESAYLFAQAMGETSARIPDSAGTLIPQLDNPADPPEIYEYRYLDGDVLHYKVVGEGHNLGGNATDATRREIFEQFLGVN